MVDQGETEDDVKGLFGAVPFQGTAAKRDVLEFQRVPDELGTVAIEVVSLHAHDPCCPAPRRPKRQQSVGATQVKNAHPGQIGREVFFDVPNQLAAGRVDAPHYRVGFVIPRRRSSCSSERDVAAVGWFDSVVLIGQLSPLQMHKSAWSANSEGLPLASRYSPWLPFLETPFLACHLRKSRCEDCRTALSELVLSVGSEHRLQGIDPPCGDEFKAAFFLREEEVDRDATPGTDGPGRNSNLRPIDHESTDRLHDPRKHDELRRRHRPPQ